MHKPDTNPEAGFNLIEITIVFSIISALVGTIMIGRELVSGGKVVAVISELAYFTQAKEQFKQQYSYLPGDLPTDVARQYFTRGFTDPTCADAGFLGDGKWEQYMPIPGNNEVDGSIFEVDYAFNQLSVGGFIKQTINFDPCKRNSGLYTTTPGVHRPASDADGSVGYTFQGLVHIKPSAGNLYFLNAIKIGREGEYGSAGDFLRAYLSGGAFNAAFFRQIDAKVDQPDTPVRGKFIVDYECWSDANGSAYAEEDDNTLCNGYYVETDAN